MMKYVFGIALALGLAFAAYGAAASLSVNGGTIQSGEDVLLTCTEAANVLGWGLESDTDEVHSVRIALDNACAGNAIFVTVSVSGLEFTASQDPITDECDGEPAGQLCVSLGAGDGFISSAAVLITGIQITIEGPSGAADDAPTGP